MPKPSIQIRVPVEPSRVKADALILARTSDAKRSALPERALGDRRIVEAVKRLQTNPTVGTIDASLLDGAAFDRLAVVSIGPSERVDAEAVRQAGAAAAKWATSLSLRRVAVSVDASEITNPPAGLQAWCEGMVLSRFRFTRHRRPDANAPTALSVELLSRSAAGRRRASADARTATMISEAVNLARELAHEPANVIHPVSLAARARQMARRHSLRCSVLDERQLRQRKMGAILAVGQGSATPPRLIVLEHRGSGRGRPVVLVGKAITFDTGGYTLKPGPSMVGMKYDKCGGMAVLAAMQAVADLKLKTPVIGIVAAAENMISDKAYRPNDIIRSLSGKTIEIISTDAEGRLVLADALTHAQQTYKPRAMIDVATLTGGARVALGTACGALMSNNDDLSEALTAAGQRTHERLWRLPLWDDYRELIQTDDADIKNSGGREAHAITGGIFLKEFVDDRVPWAHLDIAAVAEIEKEGPYCPKGATGFGVRLLVDYLTHL